MDIGFENTENLIKRIESTDPGYVRRLYLMLRIS